MAANHLRWKVLETVRIFPIFDSRSEKRHGDSDFSKHLRRRHKMRKRMCHGLPVRSEEMNIPGIAQGLWPLAKRKQGAYLEAPLPYFALACRYFIKNPASLSLPSRRIAFTTQ
jgi:hypothetical protein